MGKHQYDYEKYREYQLEYQRNSPVAKAARKRYYLMNKDKWAGYSEKYRQTRHGQLSAILNRVKSQAAIKGLPFELTLEWMLAIPPVCPVLGMPLLLGKSAKHPNSPAIDTIDPNLGYTTKNSRIVSSRAKSLKSDGTREEFQKIFTKMYDL